MADYDVYKSDDGWVAKREDASRASSVHDTQAAAHDAARGYAGNNGGGEVSIHGRDRQRSAQHQGLMPKLRYLPTQKAGAAFAAATRRPNGQQQ
jgi:hypothetical protein